MNDLLTRFERVVGLTGPGSVEIKINCPNLFDIPPEERRLVFAVVDAVNEFAIYAERLNRAGKR